MEQKEKFYKKQWFMWVLLIFFPPIGIIFMWITKKDFKVLKKVLITIFALLWWIICISLNNSNAPSTNTTATTEENTTEATTTEEVTTETTTTEESSSESSTEEIAAEEYSATLGQQNALSRAKDYLNYTAFSYSGLIKQLEFEGFSTEEATYAADNCGADWNEQAAKKAKEYLDYSSFSRQGLIDQLVFEGFTSEQAEYGATSVGY